MIAALHLIPISVAGGGAAPPFGLLDRLAAALARALSVSCRVASAPLALDNCFDEIRRQAHSSAILAGMAGARKEYGAVLVGVIETDLYVPVLTFVFGEGQISGSSAVVSTHRLREEFYGLPPDEEKLIERLLKETLHELGHTRGLRHCTDWRCVMSSAHSVERVDIRQPAYCQACASALNG